MDDSTIFKALLGSLDDKQRLPLVHTRAKGPKSPEERAEEKRRKKAKKTQRQARKR